MTTPSAAAAGHPVQVFGRMAGVLAMLSATIVNGSGAPDPARFQIVLWTAVLALGFYACVLAVATLAGRPLLSRGHVRLEALLVLVLIAVAGWAAVDSALSSQWSGAVMHAVVVAVNLCMLWLLWRQLHAMAPSPADSVA